MMTKKRWKIAGSILILGLAFTGLMGFAHTKAGRPVLAWMGKLLGKKEFCPLGYDHTASLADRELARSQAAAARINEKSATSRVVFDFELGSSSRTEIHNWVVAHQGQCRHLKSDFEMECVGPFFQSISSTFWLEFDAKEKLVSFRGIEKFKEADKALGLFQGLQQSLKKNQEGSHVSEEGVASKEFLMAGLLREASIQADFKNYKATARLANMGDGIALTHEFLVF